MFKQISTFIEMKISQYLCGFRKGYNTQHALMKLFDKLNKNVDKGIKVRIFMMDLSKAFDCISHDLLIVKLHVYGSNKPSYLNGRIQKSILALILGKISSVASHKDPCWVHYYLIFSLTIYSYLY